MGVLIDASVLIGWDRAGVDLGARVRGRGDEALFLSVITASELLYGVHRADERGRRARRSAFVEAVIDAFPLLPVDLRTARLHAELWAGPAAAVCRRGSAACLRPRRPEPILPVEAYHAPTTCAAQPPPSAARTAGSLLTHTRTR